MKKSLNGVVVGYKKRVDNNQKDIVKHLRVNNWKVFHTHIVGNGFPDIIASKEEYQCLVEIKSEKGSLTPKEIDFFNEWEGDVIIVTSPTDCLNQLEFNLNEFKKDKLARYELRKRDE